MSFDSVGDFLAMGGHGLYVWLAYGAAVIIVTANVISVRIGKRRSLAEARSLERRLVGGTSVNPTNPTNAGPEGPLD